MTHPFNLSQGASSQNKVSAPMAPSSLTPDHLPRPKQQHPSQDPVDVLPPSGTTSKATPEGTSSSKLQVKLPLHKALSQSHREAFNWDSSLVKEAREEYFKRHSLNFNDENIHNFTGIFRLMIESAGLFGSSIHEIQEVWTGPDELWQANYVLRALPKGLKFPRGVSPSKSPKVMGLMDIHNPDAPHHINGVTHCSWCSKVGQNEDTVVNHLRTAHYKLGLICKKCFNCLSTTLESICRHGWKDCQPSGEGSPDESSSSSYWPAHSALGQTLLNRNLDGRS